MKKIVRKRAALAAVLIITSLSLSGCERIREVYGRRSAAAEAVEIPSIIYAVNTTVAAQGPIQDHFALSGDVIAASTVDAFSDAAGRVSGLFIQVGSRVQRNQIIAEVDPSRPGMEFVPSPVRSPVTGTVVALPAQLGMTISQAVPMARITAGDGLEIRLHVAERFIYRVALNQPVEILLNAWPGEILQGRITELSPTLDPISRTMEVRVRVYNPGTRLMAGMFAQVRIITAQRESVVQIPSAAKITRFGEQFVFVVDSTNPEAPVARRRNIVSGIMIDGVMEILEGLSAGEEVVVRGQTIIYDGARTNIVERLEPINVN